MPFESLSSPQRSAELSPPAATAADIRAIAREKGFMDAVEDSHTIQIILDAVNRGDAGINEFVFAFRDGLSSDQLEGMYGVGVSYEQYRYARAELERHAQDPGEEVSFEEAISFAKDLEDWGENVWDDISAALEGNLLPQEIRVLYDAGLTYARYEIVREALARHNETVSFTHVLSWADQLQKSGMAWDHIVAALSEGHTPEELERGYAKGLGEDAADHSPESLDFQRREKVTSQYTERSGGDVTKKKRQAFNKRLDGWGNRANLNMFKSPRYDSEAEALSREKHFVEGEDEDVTDAASYPRGVTHEQLERPLADDHKSDSDSGAMRHGWRKQEG